MRCNDKVKRIWKMLPPMKVFTPHLTRTSRIVPLGKAGSSKLFCTPQAAHAFRVFITAES